MDTDAEVRGHSRPKTRTKLTQAEVRAMHDVAKRISIARDAITALYVYGIMLEAEHLLEMVRWIKFSRTECVVFEKLKHDPRDKFVRVGGFHGARDATDSVVFRPHERFPQGNGELSNDYCVRLPGKGRRGRR